VTLADALRCATKHFAALRILETSNPRLEAELLLQHTLGFDRIQLYQHLHDEMPPDKELAYHDLVWRRLCGEPTPYIIGRADFYDIELAVAPVAAIPRPETELLVEEASALAGERLQDTPTLAIVDVGTGCGTIALALATHLPAAQIIATDISSAALALAQGNAESLGLASSVRFLCGDLLAPLEQPVDIVVANLPYVRSTEWERLPVEIRCHEPREALDGGPDGLDSLRIIAQDGPRFLTAGGVMVLEVGDGQAADVAGMLRRSVGSAEILKDYAGRERIVVGRNAPQDG
jgi:release factor glutamine methyltransferase